MRREVPCASEKNVSISQVFLKDNTKGTSLSTRPLLGTNYLYSSYLPDLLPLTPLTYLYAAITALSGLVGISLPMMTFSFSPVK